MYLKFNHSLFNNNLTKKNNIMYQIKKTITNTRHEVSTAEVLGYFETMVFDAEENDVFEVRANDKETALKNHSAAVKKFSLNMTPAEIATILKIADQSAQEFRNYDDGGACNFDAPVINLKGKRTEFIKEIEKLSGLSLCKNSGYWAGTYTVIMNSSGQGLRRTKMAQTFKNTANAAGLPMLMYYQLD